VSRRAQQCQARKGRPARELAFAECNVRYFAIATIDQGSPETVIREGGLDEYFTGPVFTARPPGNLNDGLRHTLATSKVGAEQSLVGIHDTDECQIRKMMSL